MNTPVKTLLDAFKASKKTRQVLSKQIVWESGVSKSQFYRIISGKETPSPETKTRICEALNISHSEFDALQDQSKLDLEAEIISAKPRGLTKPVGLLLAAIMIGAIVLFAINAQRPSASETVPALNTVVTNPDDSTLFIEDVTIPDGTAIPVNTTFVKTWRVKNIGKVTWKHRYLKRVTPQSDLVCSSPAMVPIPVTLPGETVDISVTFTTPHLPGSCRTDWKSADENGNLHFPEMHGLFSIVTVTE